MRNQQHRRDERFAASYDRALAGAEGSFLAAARASLLSGLTGRIVDIGAGTGANLPYFDAASELTLVEPSRPMRERLLGRVQARSAAGSAVADVVAASAEELPFPDGRFDVVVCTLTLCSVAHQDAALGEIVRILRPGGRLAFLEHCRAPGLRGLWQRAVSPITQRYAGGCRCDRDTVAAICAVGLQVEHSAPVEAPWPYSLLPENPFIAGRALRAA